jgi:hypothetical protein
MRPALIRFALVVVLAPGISAARALDDGIWIDRHVLAGLPVTGLEWSRLVAESRRACPTPLLNDQDDQTNTCVMAKALVAARTNDAVLRGEVIAVLEAIADGPPYHGRALALGRKLIGYVVAADIISLRHAAPAIDERFRVRIQALLTSPTIGGPANLIECHETRANNWGTHCGASRIAVAAYLGDLKGLDRAAMVFKGFLGDRSAYARFTFRDLSWQCDRAHPVPINPAHCTVNGQSLDGVLPDDQRRGGSLRWPAPRENYVYEALQGALAQAIILDRAGYDAFEWQDRALKRAFEWLYTEARFPASGDDAWEAAVINYYYGTSFAPVGDTRPGKNVGWTEWTHAR